MTFRIVPSSDRYPGITEITNNGRSWICVGTGKHVEQALKKAAGVGRGK